jgi:translocation and assembly module TamA
MIGRLLRALALGLALGVLSGCASGPLAGLRPGTQAAAATGPAAFELEVRAPDRVRDYLLRHLELQRFRDLPDLDTAELRRLLTAADANARELLGTLGYFSPDIAIELREGTAASSAASAASSPASVAGTGTGAAGEEAARAPQATRTVILTVQPGQPVRISGVDIGFAGPVASDSAAATQRASIEAQWPLKPGMAFSQAGWDDAKAVALRLLTSIRYPLGQIESSRADIDADQRTATLSLKLDSGPAFRFGPMQVKGHVHYGPELVERLARLPAGADYDQQRLLEAQQRVADSGYFDSVFFTLDTEGDPQAAPVVAQVREAKLQKIVLGVGASTDSGPRLSVEHTHHKLPLLGWRAVSKIAVDRDTQSLSTELTSQPDAGYWRWVTSALLQSKETNEVKTASQRYRLGRSQTGERIDRNYFLQYDQARDSGFGLSSEASSISANYAWTQRNFDSVFFPSRGWGLGVELGGGTTLGSQQNPFLRTRANWLGYWPLGSIAQADGSRGRGGRIALRAEGGAVLAREGATLPSTQLFLAGGDNSVRGYGLRDIGIQTGPAQISAGRYLTVGSVEWQRPLVIGGQVSDWETAVFVDAGAVADRPAELKAKVGVGVGARWRSPVGPLQIDLAYGVATQRFRLHLNVGFTF